MWGDCMMFGRLRIIPKLAKEAEALLQEGEDKEIAKEKHGS